MARAYRTTFGGSISPWQLCDIRASSLISLLLSYSMPTNWPSWLVRAFIVSHLFISLIDFTSCNVISLSATRSPIMYPIWFTQAMWSLMLIHTYTWFFPLLSYSVHVTEYLYCVYKLKFSVHKAGQSELSMYMYLPEKPYMCIVIYKYVWCRKNGILVANNYVRAINNAMHAQSRLV